MNGGVGVVVKSRQINTHWKLLALSYKLANFTRGTAFRRLLLHPVHVQYCAFTLSPQKETQQGLDSVFYADRGAEPVIYGNVRFTFQGSIPTSPSSPVQALHTVSAAVVSPQPKGAAGVTLDVRDTHTHTKTAPG